MAQPPEWVVRRVYELINGSDPRVFDYLDPDIEWVTPESLPWTLPGSGGCYRGHDALAEYFTHCVAQVDELRVEVTDLRSVRDQVLALGYECGRSRRTGKSFRARFAQVWTTKDGKITKLEGFPDTAAMTAAFRLSDEPDSTWTAGRPKPGQESGPAP